MVLDGAHHARRIRQILEKGQFSPSDVSDVVLNSWRRCMEDYGLNPEHSQAPPVLTRSEFLERQDHAAQLLYEASQEMELLYHQLADSQLVVVLVDREGTILHLVASPDLRAELETMSLCRGAVWSERFAGSNGMGTCLATLSPTLIQTTDHFFPEHTVLTCTAVPIFAPQGELIAALNVTARSGLMPHSSMVLMNLAARMIENRLMEAFCGDAFSLYFHVQPESVNIVYGGKLMVSAQDGSIIAANRSALLLLGLQHTSELCGRSVESVFQSTFETLLQRSIEHSFQPIPVYGCGLGNRFFAVAQYSRKKLSQLVASGGQIFCSAYKQDLYKSSESLPPRNRMTRLEVEFGDVQIQASFQQALKVAKYQVPILLQGEVGTGKEHFARALHHQGERSQSAFVILDCMVFRQTRHTDENALGETASDIEQDMAAQVEQAGQGILFLDKVEELSASAQAQLLSILDKQDTRGHEQQVLIVASSTEPLLERVADGRFRADLYYRIGGLELTLAPFRERSHRSDLFRAILRQEDHCEYMSDEAEKWLLAYQWPGNVRQLRHVLRAMVAQVDDGHQLQEGHVPMHLLRATPPSVSSLRLGPATEIGERLQVSSSEAVQSTTPEPIAGLNPLEQTERITLLQLLEGNRWNISSVSKQLKLSRNTLYRKLNRLQIPLRSE
ncbi:sigma 54-interacting transcriptional regulator [Paenalcaligenes niemegkensis]|uniref:sigma-54-dependent Fis family transcriptional regulator n=1 Tax=Paenalcaligenes niemegkensis TaxID=2895469 RepID=UPI001EE8394A|nr:sigma 54-interacting transcriptional regulator [Paenalcaligenes niemegkensis]MCQ9615841.1 sigma 54-interacting transcriptional regulator [Paenalcaligenes niemegkensis]